MFEKSAAEIAELRFQILNAMMDDSEDVEQVYLSTNETRFETETQPQFPLREIIDEMKFMLEEGYIKPDFSNDEKLAPLGEVNLSLFHHYWFSPTKRGKEVWEVTSGRPPANRS
jgi:hypothetical protein